MDTVCAQMKSDFCVNGLCNSFVVYADEVVQAVHRLNSG
jgi:hypothetical protein